MKAYLLSGLLIISTITAYGQESKSQQLGAHVGATIATIIGPATIILFENTTKSNVYFGADYHYNFGKTIGFETQLNFLNIGCGYKDSRWDGINDNITGKVDLNSNLKYINLPVSLTVSPLKKNILMVNFGLYGSRLLSAKITGDPIEYSLYYPSSIKEDITDILKKWDAGFTLGIQSEIPFYKALLICLNGNYSRGLIKMQKNTNDTYYNSFIMTCLGIKVQLGK